MAVSLLELIPVQQPGKENYSDIHNINLKHVFIFVYCLFLTSAYIANRVTDKLTKVCDNIYCCRSGSAADTQAITDIVAYYMDLSR